MKGRIRLKQGMIVPEYQLFIHPINLNELRKDIWIDDPIPAKLTDQQKEI